MSMTAIRSPTVGWASPLATTARLLCFLDYDGTLAPIAATPGEAVPLPGTKEIVEAFAATPGTSVAIITGRSITDIRRLFDVATAHYLGVHGIEYAAPGANVTIAPEAAKSRADLIEIRDALGAAFNKIPGILIEDKGAALACHYRGAARADGQRLRTAVSALAEKYLRAGAEIELISGHAVIELRPPGINKGTAACQLLSTMAPALALYIGDDNTDEDAFARLPPDSFTVRVARRRTPTRAAYRLEDPIAVQSFLGNLLASRARPQSPLAGLRPHPT